MHLLLGKVSLLTMPVGKGFIAGVIPEAGLTADAVTREAWPEVEGTPPGFTGERKKEEIGN